MDSLQRQEIKSAPSASPASKSGRRFACLTYYAFVRSFVRSDSLVDTFCHHQSFRGHYQSWVIPRVQLGVQIQLALNFLFGLLELGCGYSAGGVVAVLCLRLAIIVSLTAFLFISLDDRIHKIMDPLALGLYTVSNAIDRLVLFSVISGSLVV